MNLYKQWIEHPNIDPKTGRKIESFSHEFLLIQQEFLQEEIKIAKSKIQNIRSLNLKSPTFRIFLFHKSQGLINDAEIYQRTLPGMTEVIYHYDYDYKYVGCHSEIDPYPIRTVNIYLESLPRESQSFASASYNFFMINPEISHAITYYPLLDGFICKTQYAKKIIEAISVEKQLDSHSMYTSHTSKDMLLANIKKNYNEFLHLGGISNYKQTDVVIDTWLQHPEFPKITIIARHPRHVKKLLELEDIPANICFIKDEIEFEDLKLFMNRIGCHLCPSLTEGWGHYINEARSCKAFIITNDAPPMNELVQSSFGLLVHSRKGELKIYQHKYHITPEMLAEAVVKVMEIPEKDKQKMGELAREAYLLNHQVFETRLKSHIQNIFNR